MSKTIYFILFFTIFLRIDSGSSQAPNPSYYLLFATEQHDVFNTTSLSESEQTSSEQEDLDLKNTDIGQNDDLTPFDIFFIKLFSASLIDIYKLDILNIFHWQLNKPPIIYCPF